MNKETLKRRTKQFANEAELCPTYNDEIAALEKEANELTSIFAASVVTVKNRLPKSEKLPYGTELIITEWND